MKTNMKGKWAVCAALIMMNVVTAQTIDQKTTATFQMKAHTTAGYDFETNRSGLETQIDQIQIWFELFPYGTYGLNPKLNGKGLKVILKAEGFKSAFKWFGKEETPVSSTEVDNNGNVSNVTAQTSESYCERLVAGVVYGNYNFMIMDSDNPIWFSDASRKGIFSGLEERSWANALGFPWTGMSKDLVGTTKGSFDSSGLMSVGYNTDTFGVDLKAASKGTWLTNEENAWIFGGDINYKPLENMSIRADGLGTINYCNVAGYDDMYVGGASVDYALKFSDERILKPYIGFDGKYKDENFAYELGIGTFYYWRGDLYEVAYDTLGLWDKTIPVGASVSFNIDSDCRCNLQYSLFEDSAEGGLIPNVGGFMEFEAKNMFAVNDEDCQLAAGGQIEYRISKKIRPYVFEKWVQGYDGNNRLTGSDNMETRVGVLLTPAAHFTIDVRYTREDVVGDGVNLDNGRITTKFGIKL